MTTQFAGPGIGLPVDRREDAGLELLPFILGEGGVEGDVGQQPQHRGPVFFETLGGDVVRVVAAVGGEAGAEVFDLLSDLPGRARGGALDLHLRGGVGDALLTGRVGQEPADLIELDRHGGHEVASTHQQAKPVGQDETARPCQRSPCCRWPGQRLGSRP